MATHPTLYNQSIISNNVTQMGKNYSSSNREGLFANEDNIKSISEAEFSFDKGEE